MALNWMVVLFLLFLLKMTNSDWSFSGGLGIKTLPANAGDEGLIPDLGRSHMP